VNINFLRKKIFNFGILKMLAITKNKANDS
jgi:hypothetical protein